MVSEFFPKKSWKLSLLKSMLAFQLKDIFFVLVCFCLFSLPKHTYIYIVRYLCYIHDVQGILLPKHTYIYFVKYFCYIHVVIP